MLYNIVQFVRRKEYVSLQKTDGSSDKVHCCLPQTLFALINVEMTSSSLWLRSGSMRLRDRHATFETSWSIYGNIWNIFKYKHWEYAISQIFMLIRSINDLVCNSNQTRIHIAIYCCNFNYLTILFYCEVYMSKSNILNGPYIMI